jgi:alpha-galactosidase
MKNLLLLLCTISFIKAFAIDGRQIVIETHSIALVFGINENNRFIQNYIGKKLSVHEYQQLKTGKEAYMTAGMENQNEPAIRIIHPDGNSSLELDYVSHKTLTNGNVEHTDIILKDPVYPIEVDLHFTSYYKEDVIESHVSIHNGETKPIVLSEYASSMLHFNAGSYWLTQFHGDWAREVEMVDEKLTNGIKNIESKLGTRSNFYQTQAFFVSMDKPSTETEGEVIAGTLAWTGNYKYSFEIDQRNSLRIRSGINSFASDYHLQPGEVFTTPGFIFTYSTQGKGEASRNLHKWARNYAVLNGNGSRMTLLNNWEATGMKFNEKRLVELFDGAKKLGVDLFLLDDGWFGNKYPRDDDKAGLGDWQADSTKLPHGIGYLIKEARAKGIKFGIWIEPEMVNPKSELYEQHPGWILKLPNRPENYGRNQLVLDLTNPEVQQFVFSIIDNLVTKNPGLAFIKWDCNRSMTNQYSPYLKEKQSHLFIEYTRGFYKVMDRIRAKYPNLPIMLCSGGGGRTDYGALKYFTEFWPSDNTDPVERIYIQWGYSYFFPANTISAHVTNMGKQSLKYRTDVAMMDKLGYDIAVEKFSANELQFSKQAIETYKRISPVIWYGDLYRIESPYESNRVIVMYVDENKSKAILYNYHLNTRRQDIFNNVKLQGLDENKKYLVEESNLFPGTKSNLAFNEKVFTGEYLMNIGLNLSPRPTPLISSIFEITEQK